MSQNKGNAGNAKAVGIACSLKLPDGVTDGDLADYIPFTAPTEGNVRSGMASHTDRLKAEAYVLETRIALEKTKAETVK